MTKFYIAARFDRWAEMNEHAAELRALGYGVDCRWLQGLHQLHQGASAIDQPQEQVPLEARPFAQDDVEDIIAADAIILFSEYPNSHSKRGGRHVEFGLALGLGKALFVIGPRENVFHCLPQVHRYETWEDFLRGKRA